MKWENIQKIRNFKFRKLLKICENNPYYRNKVKKVLKIEELSKLPILTRKILQNKSLLTYNMPKRRVRFDSTSGSTGQPLRFAKDQSIGEPVKIATEMLFNSWSGLQFGEKHAQLWGHHKRSFLQNFWFRYLYRCKQFPPYYSDIDSFEIIQKELNTFKPEILTGYSSALYLAAVFSKQSDIELKYKLKSIIASAEMLLSSRKQLIEDVFQCPVFMRYGTRELDNIGMECSEKNGYHYVASRYIIEIINSTGEVVSPGEEGRLVITDLNNYVMPLIRYEIGDTAIMSDETCSCGRTWPIIEQIRGRIGDFLILPSGKLFPFLLFNVIFEQAGDIIREFQLIQKTKSLWLVKLVKNPNFDEKKISQLKKALENETYNEVEISFLYTDKIERTPSGKFRYIIRSDESPFIP
ncbi:MAG: phenylacetate--CoA ligase family protein [Candidatus Thorarchaeota archaeon]